jgi:hypothetical protein
MKTKTLILVVVLFFAVSLLFAEDEISVNDIYGTWVNADYNQKSQYAKWINLPDGTYEVYNKIMGSEKDSSGKQTITDSWYDEEGNLWIQCIYERETDDTVAYVVYKLSDSGKIRETVWSKVDYPEEMSPIGGEYSLHYRQE